MKLPVVEPNTLRGIFDKIEYSKRKSFISREVYSSSSRITERETITDCGLFASFFFRLYLLLAVSAHLDSLNSKWINGIWFMSKWMSENDRW